MRKEPEQLDSLPRHSSPELPRQVLIPLPVEGPQAMWYTIGDDSGVAVMGSGGGFAEVQVQIVMPGQVRPPVPTHPTQPQVTQNTTSNLVPQAPPAPVGGTQSRPKPKLDLKGYTNEQIKDALLKEKMEADEEERMQMEDINDDLLRAAEVEEALLSGKASLSAAPLGQSALPFSPKLGYMSPKLSYQVDPGTMQPPPTVASRDTAGTTQQQPMPYFGTIAQPKSAAPQGMSMPPGMSAMPNGMSSVPVSGSRVPTAIVNGVPVYSDNAAVRLLPPSHPSIRSPPPLATPFSLSLSLLQSSRTASHPFLTLKSIRIKFFQDPFGGAILGNKINAAPVRYSQPPMGYSQPPMNQSAGPPGLPSGFVPSGPQQPRR